MTKAVFLDRDGVINVNCPRAHDYIKSVEELALLPGAATGVARLNDAGFLVVVATNQRGIARGMMTEGDLAAVHAAMEDELAKSGAHVDAIYVCPHDSGECECRKPLPGLLLQASKDLDLDLAESWMVGDHLSDVRAGKAAGVRTILVGGEASDEADFVCDDLLAAAGLIIDRS